MKNNKGQALIEFVLILPVLLLIMTCIFDIGSILYQKSNIQNDLDVISNYVLNEESENANIYANKKKLILSIDDTNDLTNIKVEYKMKLNTPGLNKVLGNPYKIIEEKKVYKQKELPDTNDALDEQNKLNNEVIVDSQNGANKNES